MSQPQDHPTQPTELSALWLPEGLLYEVLLHLPPKDIVRAQLVCKSWKEVATLARKETFLRRWQFATLLNSPRHLSLYEAVDLGQCVTKHAVGAQDTLAQLSLKYGVDIAVLKRLNNLANDHLLHHRPHIYVPVSTSDKLVGQLALFEYCPVLRRDLLLVLPPCTADLAQATDAANLAAQLVPEQLGAAVLVTFNRLLLREMRSHVRRLLKAQGRSTQHMASVDIESARYYLGQVNGHTQQAASMFVEDLEWEETEPTATLLGGALQSSSSSAALRLTGRQRPPWLVRLASSLFGCSCVRRRHKKQT